jgi:hypothetical protein
MVRFQDLIKIVTTAIRETLPVGTVVNGIKSRGSHRIMHFGVKEGVVAQVPSPFNIHVPHDPGKEAQTVPIYTARALINNWFANVSNVRNSLPASSKLQE